MLPVSQAFLNAVRGSHGIVSTVTLLTPPGVTGTAVVGRSLAIISGSVTLDATADIRGTCDITVKEPWPTGNTTADLVPYGTEIQVTRGIRFANGNVELAPLGIYRLTAVEQDDAPKGSLRLTGSDRMFVISNSKLIQPVNFLSSVTFGTVMSQLVLDVLPTAVISWQNADGSVDTATPATAINRNLTAEQDRFGFLNDMVTGLARIWYFDYRGVLVIKPIPVTYTYIDPVTAAVVTVTAPNTAPVWTANAGPGGVLVDASRNLTQDNVYNAVAVVGEALDSLPPPQVNVFDTDPTSVTFYGGPFGKVPLFYSNPVITNNSQAAAAGAALLAQNKGLPYTVNFTEVPNPALEPYDLVTLVYPIDLTAQPHQKIEQHRLQQVVVGLGSDQGMACATRLTNNNGVIS